jgi:WD40 repeat protein
MLASGSKDNTTKLWNISNGSLISDLTGHENHVIFYYKYN